MCFKKAWHWHELILLKNNTLRSVLFLCFHPRANVFRLSVHQSFHAKGCEHSNFGTKNHVCTKFLGQICFLGIGVGCGRAGWFDWTPFLKAHLWGLKLAWHNKIMDKGSEWPSEQSLCKLYMRAPNPEPHKPWLNLTQHSTMKPQPSKRAHVKRGIWLISRWNQKCHVGATEFSSQMQKSHKYAFYMYFRIQKCPSFYRCVQHTFTVQYFLPSDSFSQFQLCANSGKNVLYFCNLPKQVCFHSNDTCQVSVKAKPQPKSVCV